MLAVLGVLQLGSEHNGWTVITEPFWTIWLIRPTTMSSPASGSTTLLFIQ
ncbi:hypothetical protein Hanom_Chr13g01230851 [Helianthus anomalus]